MSEGLYVELGGGRTPRGQGWLNVDIQAIPGVDVVCDFDKGPLPFADDSVAALYSAHCFEHLADYGAVLREVARVCRAGASVELRFPHWLAHQALCAGHRCTISDRQVRIWDEQPEHWFAGCGKRLKLLGVCYIPDVGLDEVRGFFPDWGDERIMRFIPGTCHEVRFGLRVEPYTL